LHSPYPIFQRTRNIPYYPFFRGIYIIQC
jgi:hypothetical protein